MGKYNEISFDKSCPVKTSLYEVGKEAPHYHDSVLEFIMCLQGNVRTVSSHRNLILQAGDIIVINPHDIHYTSSGGPNVVASFYFDLDAEELKFGDKDIRRSYFDCYRESLSAEALKKKDNVMRILLAILFFTNNRKCVSTDSQKELSRKLVHLSRKIIEAMLEDFQSFFTPNTGNPYSKELKNRFERVMAYLMKNYQDKITVSEISSMENINSNYFSQFFKRTTSIGITKLLAFIRVRESEVLLLDSDFDITDIAYECGFPDPKAYYKAFKEVYNNSPNQHRKHLARLVEEADENKPLNLNDESGVEYYIALFNSLLMVDGADHTALYEIDTLQYGREYE